MPLLHVEVLGLRGKNIRCMGATALVVVFFSGAFLAVLRHSLPKNHPTTRTVGNRVDQGPTSGGAGGAALGPEAAMDYMTLHYQSDKELVLRGLQPLLDKNFTKALRAKHHNSRITKKLDSKGRRDNEDKLGKEGLSVGNFSLKVSNNVTKQASSENHTNSRDQVQKNNTSATPQAEHKPPPQQKQQQQQQKQQQQPPPPPQKQQQSLQSPATTQLAHTAIPRGRESMTGTATHSMVQQRQPTVPGPTDTMSTLGQSRFQTPLSTLKTLPVQAFMSPFIETDEPRPKPEKKVITWYQSQSNSDLNRRKRVLKNCPQPKCRLVYPLPDGQRADAVVFTADSYTMATNTPPVRDDSYQVFVLHGLEPTLMIQPNALPTAWKSVFNWTWSYRRDSDIWQPLGQLTLANNVPPVADFGWLSAGKSSPIAWIPNTCAVATSSRRHQFVEDLRKHVPVAEFGPCLNGSVCARDNKTCAEILSTTFFFLLALEDDLCKDYVTDVFYRAWEQGTHVVPVVRGGADYSSYFPEGTYVNANWFNNVKELHNFLSELIRDRNLYTQLLWRKAHWVKVSKQVESQALCHLCYKLHHLPSHRRTYSDINRWLHKGQCQIKQPKPQ